jgi:hypothetical protein
MIEICREPPNEARQGPISDQYEHGRARGEEGSGSAILKPRLPREKEVVIGEERPLRMIKPKSPKDDQWQKNEGGKPQRRLKATFDILLAKYKESKAGIRGHENRTIRNHKPDSPVSLS